MMIEQRMAGKSEVIIIVQHRSEVASIGHPGWQMIKILLGLVKFTTKN